jgi:UDP-N-acetylglucosamine 2-epimerase (non-hydrolysing)
MKILHVIGNRPQFIKLGPVLKASERYKEINNVCLHTGQHYDYNLSKLFFDELKIQEPDYNLGVGSGTQGYQTGEMIKRIEEVLIKEEPDLVLVYGDTNSTLAGALAAVKLHIKIGHVEAGLRSYDKSMPEEINRVLTDHCSDLLFCPTKTSIANLNNEGLIKSVYLTGDVMVDTLLYNRGIAEKSNIIEELGLKNKDYFVITVHRASNTNNEENLKNMMEAFCEIDEKIVFPIHPRTEKFLRQYGLYEKLKTHVNLIKPLGYLDFLKLISHSKKILTDSGGIQKEAYILKVPCITLRETTEWIETVEDGWNVLVGTNKKKIIKRMDEFEPNNEQRGVFGCGDASERIITILIRG